MAHAFGLSKIRVFFYWLDKRWPIAESATKINNQLFSPGNIFNPLIAIARSKSHYDRYMKKKNDKNIKYFRLSDILLDIKAHHLFIYIFADVCIILYFFSASLSIFSELYQTREEKKNLFYGEAKRWTIVKLKPMLSLSWIIINVSYCHVHILHTIIALNLIRGKKHK